MSSCRDPGRLSAPDPTAAEGSGARRPLIIGNSDPQTLARFYHCHAKLNLLCYYCPAVVGFLERLGFYGVQGNLIMFLTGPLGMSTASAAAGVNAWAGTVQVLPLVCAFAADARFGRYRAVLAASVFYLLVGAFGRLH